MVYSPQDSVDVMFRAKADGDGEFCNMKASEMASRLNSGSGTLYLEESLVAAAIAIPPVDAVAPPAPRPISPPTSPPTSTSTRPRTRTLATAQQKNSSRRHVLGQCVAFVSALLVFLTD